MPVPDGGGFPASEMAEERPPLKNPDPTTVLVVTCGPYRLGIPAVLVRGVVAAGDIVLLKHPDLEGLVWWDGALFPVTRLGPLLGVASCGGELRGHGVLVHCRHGPLCFLVDEALELVEIPGDSLRPVPPLMLRHTGLRGVETAATLEDLLLIVDPVRLLGLDRAAQLAAAAAEVSDAEASRRVGDSP